MKTTREETNISKAAMVEKLPPASTRKDNIWLHRSYQSDLLIFRNRRSATTQLENTVSIAESAVTGKSDVFCSMQQEASGAYLKGG